MRFFGRFFWIMSLCLMVFVPAVSAQEVAPPSAEEAGTSVEGSQLASGLGDSRFSPWNASSVMSYPWSYATADVIDYTSDGTDPGACSPYKNSVWFTFTAPYTGKLGISTYWSHYDTVLGVYRTSPTNANLIACSDNYNSTPQSQATISVRSGTTYYVVVGAYTGATITTDTDYLELSFVMNDYYRNGYVIPANSSSYVKVQTGTQFSTNGTDWTLPCLADPYNFNHGVWHAFKPATSAYYTFTTAGSNYNTVLGVYQNGSPLTLVGCNDNSGGTVKSRVRVFLTAGRQYFIQVGRYGSTATGTSLSTRLAMTRG